ncbi:D-alanyl-D-alanine carboxypeptidase/D-alanyl-D-alanine-endopeptidase [Segetibacter sp. 3557_3]|uniref:D-alanyl-D-alanine carboxypeptidase/D-alanyl-D-alanine endopeptidase n=1 Tax=Segetibacter sp. 3557_3 TaxID=2547429 RepID=UPI001404DA21|nr:D-alanyl-D-alanine carboxypeptidase/D-alanyl-D-alanine-endopeptidase [Segetibacter sp. 3557_3]
MCKLLIFSVFLPISLFAQSLSQKLDAGIRKLLSDSQGKHAIVALYVVNAETGKVVYDHNAQVGLAAASSQKILTSIAALELLKPSFRFETALGYTGNISSGILNGNLVLTGSGDPTLGSWRYPATKETVLLDNFAKAVKSAGITSISGNILVDAASWETQTIPGGWIWDDIGNYYGAGVAALNWRENQFDLKLKPGRKEGDPASVVSTLPPMYGVHLVSELTTGKRGSGDNAVIYLAPGSTSGVVRGTIPLGEDPFTISGAMPDPSVQFTNTLSSHLNTLNVSIGTLRDSAQFTSQTVVTNKLLVHQSPPLDSINYWFLKRSINLYGEALVKTIAFQHSGFGSADTGLATIKRFWRERAIDPAEINMLDGSGLSPQNRLTAHALTTAMQYARSKPYFTQFYQALPEINNLRMKSGSIGGARSFTGYVNGKTGSYTFAIIINGYTGSSSGIVRQLYNILDILK